MQTIVTLLSELITATDQSIELIRACLFLRQKI